MYSIYFIKRLSEAIPPFDILRFDIRYSAVRCLIRAVEATRLIVKISWHFGVVSYEMFRFPGSGVYVKSELLTSELPGPDLTFSCSIFEIHIWEPDTSRNMIL